MIDMTLTSLTTSGEATGGGLNPPLSAGATHKICAKPMRKYWGIPPPPNLPSGLATWRRNMAWVTTSAPNNVRWVVTTCSTIFVPAPLIGLAYTHIGLYIHLYDVSIQRRFNLCHVACIILSYFIVHGVQLWTIRWLGCTTSVTRTL